MLGGAAALAAGAAGAAARPALAKGLGVDAPGAAEARAVLQQLLAETRSPSMSAAVSFGGEVVWAEAFGVADLETRAPATIAGRYRLASVSKLIAGATAARLAERGAIELDWPLARYRPSLPKAHHETTLRQLLAHTGGVRHYIPRDYDPKAPGGPIDYRPYNTTADALAVFIDDPLVSVPGEEFNYSTFGYTLAGAVMESATGKSFPELVAAEVSRPLGLASVLAESMTTVIPERVSCYQTQQATGQLFKAPAINPAYKWAGGGYVATAADIARFCSAFSAPGYLDPEMLRTVFRPVPPTRAPAPVQVGMAWRMDRDGAGRLRAHHAGSIAGGRSIAMLLPEAGVSVVILSNLSDLPVDPLSPAQRIADAFL
jgi:serine beta-lactamase-like protein LACTB